MTLPVTRAVGGRFPVILKKYGCGLGGISRLSVPDMLLSKMAERTVGTVVFAPRIVSPVSFIRD